MFAVAVLAANRLTVRSAILQGNAALREGNVTMAEARYEEAIAHRPDSGTARFNLGVAAYDRRQFPKAAENFEQSAANLSTPVEEAEAHYNRGISLFQSGSLLESREAFKSALRLDPSDADARYNFVLVDQLIRDLERSGGDKPNPKPLTRDQAEQMLDSLGQNTLRIPPPSRRNAPPQAPGVVDK
jgi:tetratricopeptide (TPR) repeat protein